MKKKSRIELLGNLIMDKIIVILVVILVVLILIINIMEKRRNEEYNSSNKSNSQIAQSQENNKEEGNTGEEALYEEARNLFFNEHDYEKTIEKANEVIDKFPKSYKAYNIRGIAKAYKGNFQEGMQDIDKALELNSDFGYARFNKALNYELYGEYDKALMWYDKALEVEDYVWSYYGKASIYGRKGDVENTIKYLKIAISMDSAVKDEAKTEEDFDNVSYSKEFQDLINN
ncbi:MAG: tetratricopeptide repeat protein [Clostridium sp.]